MKYVSILLVAILGGLSIAAEPASNTDQVTDTIRKMEQKWVSAAAKKDAAPLEQMLDENYILTTPQGNEVGKSDLVDRLKDGTFAVDSGDYSNIKVRVWGDTAVATGRMSLEAKWNDNDISGQYAFTDTFIHRDGKWLEVAGQVTKVEE